MSSVKGLLRYSRTKKKKTTTSRKSQQTHSMHRHSSASAAAARSIRNVYGRQRSEFQPAAVNLLDPRAGRGGGEGGGSAGMDGVSINGHLQQAQQQMLMPWDGAPIQKLAQVVADAVQLDDMVRFSQLACENYGTNERWKRLTEERLHARIRILALEKIINGRKHPRVAAAQCAVAEAYGDNALWAQASTHATECVSTLTTCGAVDRTGQLVPGAFEAFDPHVTLQVSQLHRYFGDICAAYQQRVHESGGELPGGDPAMQQAISREEVVRGLVETNLLAEFDGEGGELYRVLSGRECATDVFCPAEDPDIDAQEPMDWIAFLEALREADVPEYTRHLQMLEDSFAAPRLAVLRNVFQKASGVQAAAAAGGDELQLLLDFPHVDDVTLILRGSTRAHTFMQLEELCAQLEAIGEVSGGLLCWELFLEACHVKQRCHFVEEAYYTALRLLGEAHTMHRRLDPARQAIGAAARYLRDSVGEDHALCIPVYSALAALALVEAQTLAKQNLAAATKSRKKHLESTKARREVAEEAQRLANEAGATSRGRSEMWEWEERAKKHLLATYLADVKEDLAEDRAAKLKAALQWTYKMCATSSKAFGKAHPETALAYAWVARLEAKAGNHHEACKMWTRSIEAYCDSERVDVSRGGHGLSADADSEDGGADSALVSMTFEWAACRGVALAHTELAAALGVLDRHENQADHLYQAALVMEKVGDYDETLDLLRRWLKLRNKYDMHEEGELDVHRKVIELTQRVHGDDCLQAAHAFKGLGLALYRAEGADAASVLKRAHMLYHIYFGNGHKIVRRLEALLTKLGEKSDVFSPPSRRRRRKRKKKTKSAEGEGASNGDRDNDDDNDDDDDDDDAEGSVPLQSRSCTEGCSAIYPLQREAYMQSFPIAEEYLLLAATSLQTVDPAETLDAKTLHRRLNQLLLDDDEADNEDVQDDVAILSFTKACELDDFLDAEKACKFTEWFADTFEGISAAQADHLLGVTFAAGGKSDLGTDFLAFLFDSDELEVNEENDDDEREVNAGYESTADWHSKCAAPRKRLALQRLARLSHEESESGGGAALALRTVLENRADRCVHANVATVFLHNNDPVPLAQILGLSSDPAAADALLFGICCDVSEAKGVTLQYVGATASPSTAAPTSGTRSDEEEADGQGGGGGSGSGSSNPTNAGEGTEAWRPFESPEEVDARVSALVAAAESRGQTAVFSNTVFSAASGGSSSKSNAPSQEQDDLERLLSVFYYLSLQKQAMGSDAYERLVEAYADLRDIWATGAWPEDIVAIEEPKGYERESLLPGGLVAEIQQLGFACLLPKHDDTALRFSLAVPRGTGSDWCALVVHALVVHVFDRNGWVFRNADSACSACPAELAGWVRGVHARQRSVFAVCCAEAMAIGTDATDRLPDFSPLAFDLE